MITWIIVVLTLLLLLLFVDWSKIVKKNDRTNNVVTKKETKNFNFDLPEAEESFSGVESRLFDLAENNQSSHQVTDEVSGLLEKADIHFRKGEMKAAEKIYLQAASKDPRCSKAYSRLGVIYLEEGDNWNDAEEAFKQALKFDRENGFILNNLGLVLYHQDRYADAIRHFEQAVRLDELNASRHANLGMAYMAMRQYAKAESSFKKALKLAPQEMEYKDLLNESIEKKKAHKMMIRR